MSMTIDQFNAWLMQADRRPLVMGILNVTPDSFSDGGKFAGVDQAVEHARQMEAEGADIIDIGGESTRPGAQRVPAEGQLQQILPVLQRLKGRLAALISVDTTLSAVAEAAMDEGAAILNDISAGREDPAMVALAARRQAPIILMHMLGQPATMQADPQYKDVVGEVKRFLLDRAAAARAAGVGGHRILVDPGIGFGKTLEHNLALLRELRQIAHGGHPVVIGTSRKAFISKVTGEHDASQRVMGTAASVAWCVANGAAIVRVHDVGAMVKVVRAVRNPDRKRAGSALRLRRTGRRSVARG